MRCNQIQAFLACWSNETKSQTLREKCDTASVKNQVDGDKSTEVLIVGSADAIVQPFAMMIEILTAPIASPTMLGSFLNKCLANATV